MNNLSRKQKIWMGIGLSLLLIQLVRIDKSVPDVDPKGTFHAMYTGKVDNQIMIDIKNTCYDCHAYSTKYPWYAEVAPLSLWIKGHIDNGRDQLNFDIWNSYAASRQIHKIEECIEVLENKRMPLKSYTWLHPEAKLSDDRKALMLEFFKSI